MNFLLTFPYKFRNSNNHSLRRGMKERSELQIRPMQEQR